MLTVLSIIGAIALLGVIAWHEFRLLHHKRVINHNAGLSISNAQKTGSNFHWLARKLDRLTNTAREADEELAAQLDKTNGKFKAATLASLNWMHLTDIQLKQIARHIREQEMTNEAIADVAELMDKESDAHFILLTKHDDVLKDVVARLARLEQAAGGVEQVEAPGQALEVRGLVGCVPDVNDFSPTCAMCLRTNGLDESIGSDVFAQLTKERQAEQDREAERRNTIAEDLMGTADPAVLDIVAKVEEIADSESAPIDDTVEVGTGDNQVSV